MTSQIKITHEGPQRHEVRVRQMSGGVEIDRTVLTPGESVTLNVYANHELNVQEGREIEVQPEQLQPPGPLTSLGGDEPNAETRAAIDDSFTGHGVEVVGSVNELVAEAEGVVLGDSAEVVHIPGHPPVVDDANVSEASP